MAKSKEQKPESTDTQMTLSIEERIANRIANINTNTPSSGSLRISVKGSKFRIPDGPTSDGPLNTVVLDYTNSNAYYKDAFSEGEISKPDCWAIGKNIAEMKPHTDVTKPINDNCASCEFNQFGSSGRGKRCGNAVNLAVIPVGFEPDADMYTLKVAAKGLKAWGNYVRELGIQGMDPLQVETSIAFVEGQSYPQLKFRALGPNKQLKECGELLAKAETILT